MWANCSSASPNAIRAVKVNLTLIGQSVTFDRDALLHELEMHPNACTRYLENALGYRTVGPLVAIRMKEAIAKCCLNVHLMHWLSSTVLHALLSPKVIWCNRTDRIFSSQSSLRLKMSCGSTTGRSRPAPLRCFKAQTFQLCEYQPELNFHAGKIMPLIFCDWQSMLIYELFDNRQAISAGVYGEQLRKLAASERERRPKQLTIASLQNDARLTLPSRLATLGEKGLGHRTTSTVYP
ncbi:hypothetical protein KIN20_026650 [Parelaphostrongylus tenuis]|uniref:Uncharacterized protein n=1 Tax=Parelaphostrongylus tenuis TaxID=148309 RepID=A0AAD5WD80_PARTN|nr:hypothetical protein KIN20_026650 [Parelaphostrongylus tenuis]